MHDISPPDNIPFKNISKGSSSTGYVEKLILFLEKYLPDFAKERKVNGEMGENDLTEQLYLHLTRKAKFNPEMIEYDYVFQPEKSQKQKKQKGHPKRMDIAARLNTADVNMEVIYCIEAKKLPTPGSNRMKEYVSGEGGAIERFKKEAHGLDDVGNLLENNGIIAYITENSFTYWLDQVNQWISDQGWLDSEKLKVEYWASVGRLSSEHQRVSGCDLHLNHFWVQI